MTSMKVLVFDVETAPTLAFVWGLREENIGLNQIKNDWHIIAWAAKWLGDPESKVMYMDQRGAKNVEDDRPLLIAMWKLLDEADIVVTQNGRRFDSPKLNARFILNGMPPPSPYKHLDTYQIARNAAKFTSNKLEYLTDKLCTKYKKLAHSKFPGFSLWKECLKGNLNAWNEMKKYNKHDVLATEELYIKLRAWAPVNAAKPFEGSPCGVCGADKLAKQGIRGKFQRVVCNGCGVWSKVKLEAVHS